MASRKAVVVGGDGLPQQLQAGDTLAGAGDAWTRSKLASDYTNPLATFANITDGTTAFTYTPPANSDFIIEAELLIWTTSATNLPRVGVSVGAGQAFGAVMIDQTGATTTARVTQDGTFLAAAVNVQMPAGGVPAASTPYLVWVSIKGRSGAAPGAIALQMACETAAVATCYVKQGSEMRSRLV